MAENPVIWQIKRERIQSGYALYEFMRTVRAYIMPPINAGSLVIIKLIHVREIKTDNKRAILCVSRTYNES